MDCRDSIIAKLTKKCMDLREENKTLKYGYDLQSDIINRLEKNNQELAERVVRSEGLIKDKVVND